MLTPANCRQISLSKF